MAMNRLSIVPPVFFYTARVRQIITNALVWQKILPFLCLCDVNDSNFHGIILTCRVNSFEKCNILMSKCKLMKEVF